MNILGLTCKELAREMRLRYGKGLYHASALYREVFKKGNTSFSGMPEFPASPALGEKLAGDVRMPACRILTKQENAGVVKFASALSDDHIIESVVIPAHGRTTLCVSSQVGCRMGCRFCTTGGMGFLRDLSVEEIVWQIHAARFILGHRIDNIVFMGMGEPLDNLENVVQAVRVMSDQRGLDIALSHITISTAGHADGLRSLAALGLGKLRLAVSLNAADDGLRSVLMPINRRYSLERLKEELCLFPLARDSVIFIEYVLLAGVNDSWEEAQKLIDFLHGLPPVRVNVIAYNGGVSAPYTRPAPEDVMRFCAWLREGGLFVRVRRSRGREIMAACGQLGAQSTRPDASLGIATGLSST